MHRFRVFVSYSHEDRQHAEEVVDVLRNKMELEPIWDSDIRPGSPFSDAIKGLISHAHIFMPIITKNSQERPWVHQETGYAMAVNIPVLPIAVSTLPTEMTAQLQAIKVKEDFSDLPDRLLEVNIEQVVFPPPARPASIVEVADWPETRTELIAQYANRVVDLGAYGRIRQRGAMSSFCLPDKDVSDPVWAKRDGNSLRSPYYHLLQREERRALELHAQARGCSLIIDPSRPFDINKLGPCAARTRLETLLEFLGSMSDDQVHVVVSTRARGGNLLIVGDWFVAESLVPRPGEGYRQTVFSWHAPTVLRRSRKFDQEFDELYRASGLGPDDSRKAAMTVIEKEIQLIQKIIDEQQGCQTAKSSSSNH
jgi:TIR domain-containing protein